MSKLWEKDMIPYLRGWIGIFVFFVGVSLLFLEQTRGMAPLGIGFGCGLMSSGFQ